MASKLIRNERKIFVTQYGESPQGGSLLCNNAIQYVSYYFGCLLVLKIDTLLFFRYLDINDDTYIVFSYYLWYIIIYIDMQIISYFGSKHSTIDQILTFQNIAENYQNDKEGLFPCFVDLKKKNLSYYS